MVTQAVTFAKEILISGASLNQKDKDKYNFQQ